LRDLALALQYRLRRSRLKEASIVPASNSISRRNISGNASYRMALWSNSANGKGNGIARYRAVFQSKSANG
jgi:hypothetical protein